MPLNELWERFSVRCCHLLINALLWLHSAPKYTTLYTVLLYTLVSIQIRSNFIYSKRTVVCHFRFSFLQFVNNLSLIFNEMYWLLYVDVRLACDFSSVRSPISHQNLSNFEACKIEQGIKELKRRPIRRTELYGSQRNSKKITKKLPNKNTFYLYSVKIHELSAGLCMRVRAKWKIGKLNWAESEKDMPFCLVCRSFFIGWLAAMSGCWCLHGTEYNHFWHLLRLIFHELWQSV